MSNIYDSANLKSRTKLEWILIALVLFLLIAFIITVTILAVNLSDAKAKTIQPDITNVEVSNDPTKIRQIQTKIGDIINPLTKSGRQPSNQSTFESAVFLRQFLEKLTDDVHPAGSAANLKVSQYIFDTWKAQGLEDVHFTDYTDVLLDLPDYDNPNTISTIDSNGNSTLVSEGLDHFEDFEFANWTRTARIWWNAYAAPGNVTAELVYANYGQIDDFKFLESLNISVAGKIVLIRYGGPWRGSKVYEAEKRGAIGVILYSDPADYAPQGQAVFPNGLGLPKTGAQRGGLAQTDAGDPRTPFYPSKNYTYEYHSLEFLKRNLELPNIPVTPIGYEDAKKLFDIMDGTEVISTWKGQIEGTTYHYSSRNGTLVCLVVNNKSTKKPIRNVIASVRGAVEPDRFILVCNHYDAWSNGAVDPNSGTIAMLEMSRVLMKVINETGWRPRRSIMFAAWDSEEYGLIGSTEWVEENLKILEQRGVATLNVDIAVSGGVTLQVNAVPLMFRVMIEAAKMVKNPSANDTLVNLYSTVYDNWLHFQQPVAQWDSSIPKIDPPNGGSDDSSFISFAGIPISSITYQSDPQSPVDYALYHSMFEIRWMVENLLDPYDFALHRAVAQYWLTSTISLADSLVIPFNVSDYGWAMANYVEQLFKSVQLEEMVGIAKADLFRSDLRWAVERFKTAAETLQKLVDKANSGDSVKLSQVEALNLRLSLLERAFINPRGLPDHPLHRHVVFAPSSVNLYSGAMFPSLTDSYGYYVDATGNSSEQEKWKSVFNEELTSVRYSIESAIQMLNLGDI